MMQRFNCEWYDETIKSKRAARWRQRDVLGWINWQGSCRAISRTKWPENGCPVIYKFLKDNFIPGYRKQHPASFKKIILMQDNAQSHAGRYAISFLAIFGFKGEKLMIWPLASPDLNPIENYWFVKKGVNYNGGQQYTSTDELRHGISQAAQSIRDNEFQKLIKSVDSRLVEVLSNKGCYVNK